MDLFVDKVVILLIWLMALTSMGSVLAEKDKGEYAGANITKILDAFFEKGKYDKRVRPNYGGPPVEVGVTMHIISISSVSEVQMDFTSDFYFRQKWKDNRLSFDPYGGIHQLVVGAEVAKRIWVPDTFFANEKVASFHVATTDNTFLRIDKNGEVYRSIRLFTMHIITKLPSWLIMLCLVHLCRCQFFQRIFAPALQVEPSRGLDEYLEEVERQAERQVEEGYGHHPRHPHHHNHHNHPHSHPHENHRRHHRSRHHVTRDQMASPSIRHTNEDVFPSSDQLALMRDLNHKIDRQFRQSFHSKPFPLQLSASHPVLCKSPHIAANQLFADQSHNLMDSQSSALTAKSGDIEFHPSNYPKDFNPIIFPNPHMFEPKVIPSDPFQDLDYGNAEHADVFARGFSYNLNQNNVREFGKSGRKKKKKKPMDSVSSDDEFDRYMSDMVDDYPKPDFDEDWFEKDTMDTNQMLVKQMMPTQFKEEFTMFDPAQLRMTRVPKNKWTFMESVSSRLPADLRSKYRSNAKIWEEAMVDRNDKKKKTNTSKAEKKSGLSTKTKKNDALSKHPDNPYEKLGIAGAAYPKERDQASFNSAGYLDLLPASKPTR